MEYTAEDYERASERLYESAKRLSNEQSDGTADTVEQYRYSSGMELSIGKLKATLAWAECMVFTSYGVCN